MEQDFSPENRRSAIWATDARKMMKGQAVDVWMEKTGRAEPPDLSGIEAVQMGKIMQGPIMRIAADKFGLRVKDAEYEMTHVRYPWMKSHFDYISEDGTRLFEIKNYNAMAHKKFDDELMIVPGEDLAQCIHESEVHAIKDISLIVLFGGQELRKYDLSITDVMRESLIEDESNLWECISSDTAPKAGDAAGAMKLFPQHTAGKALIANGAQLFAALRLAEVKKQMKALSEEEDTLRDVIMPGMQDAEVLLDAQNGSPLITWKTTKPGSAFSATKFKEAYPQMYEQFVFPTPGQRRFLVK